MPNPSAKSSTTRSQEERILWLLHASWPEWTPALALSHVSLQYNARIFGLRKKGWEIANRVEVRNGVKHGSFRLATPGTFPNPKKKQLHPQPLIGSSLAPIGADEEYGADGDENGTNKSNGMRTVLNGTDRVSATLFSPEEMVNFDHEAKFYPG